MSNPTQTKPLRAVRVLACLLVLGRERPNHSIPRDVARGSGRVLAGSCLGVELLIRDVEKKS